MLIAADHRWVCAVGPRQTLQVEHRAGTPDEALAAVLGDAAAARRAFGAHRTDVGIALLNVFDGTSPAELDGGPVPGWAAADLVSALRSIAAGADPPSGHVVAGRRALHLPETLEADLRLHYLRLWVSRQRPGGLLRCYASVASGRETSIRLLVAAPQESPPTRDHPTAWSWSDGEWTCTGGCEAEPWGDLAIGEVIGTEQIDLGGRLLHVAHGFSAVSNLGAVDLGDDADPADACLGVAFDANVAAAKCVAEAAERFALGDVTASRLIRCSAVGLHREYLAPCEFVRYGCAQIERLGLDDFDPDEQEYWIEGHRLNGGRVLVPAALIYSPFPRPRWLGAGAQSSNGAAAAATARDAHLCAWRELIERDAFLRAWHSEKAPARIATSGTSEALRRWLAHRGVDVHLVQLPSKYRVPAVAALGITEHGVHVGAAAGDPSTIHVKAITEVLVQHLFPTRRTVDASGVRTPADHCGFWLRHRDSQLDRLASGTIESPRWGSDMPSGVSDEKAVFVTLRDKDPTIVKALSPSLVPMTFGYDSEPLGTYSDHFGVTLTGPLTPHPFG